MEHYNVKSVKNRVNKPSLLDKIKKMLKINNASNTPKTPTTIETPKFEGNPKTLYLSQVPQGTIIKIIHRVEENMNTKTQERFYMVDKLPDGSPCLKGHVIGEPDLDPAKNAENARQKLWVKHPKNPTNRETPKPFISYRTQIIDYEFVNKLFYERDGKHITNDINIEIVAAASGKEIEMYNSKLKHIEIIEEINDGVLSKIFSNSQSDNDKFKNKQKLTKYMTDFNQSDMYTGHGIYIYEFLRLLVVCLDNNTSGRTLISCADLIFNLDRVRESLIRLGSMSKPKDPSNDQDNKNYNDLIIIPLRYYSQNIYNNLYIEYKNSKVLT